MRIKIPDEKAYRLINHGPCCLITTGDGTRRNVAPINWTMPLSDDPPRVVSAVEPGIFTDELIRETGEFVINVVGENQADNVLFCGSHSGRTTDKFLETGLKTAACRLVKAPRLEGSLAHMECRVLDRHEYDGIHLYVAAVLHAESLKNLYQNGRFLAEKAKTLHHLSGNFFAVTDRLIRSRSLK